MHKIAVVFNPEDGAFSLMGGIEKMHFLVITLDQAPEFERRGYILVAMYAANYPSIGVYISPLIPKDMIPQWAYQLTVYRIGISGNANLLRSDIAKRLGQINEWVSCRSERPSWLKRPELKPDWGKWFAQAQLARLSIST